MKRQLQTNFTAGGIMLLAAQEVGTTKVVLFERKGKFPKLTEFNSERPLNSDQELQWVVTDWARKVLKQDVDGIRKLVAVAE
jgi:hypothetical protein